MLLFTKEEFEEGLNSIYKYTKNDYVKNNYSTLEFRLEKMLHRNVFWEGIIFCTCFLQNFYYTRSKTRYQRNQKSKIEQR